ncbi:hypothetical protein D3C76_1687240 [compost metagenome]
MSSLYPADSNAIDDLLLQNNEYDHQRHNGRNGRHHHQGDVIGKLLPEGLDAQRQRKQLLVKQENQGILVIVPVPDEFNNAGGGKDRLA